MEIFQNIDETWLEEVIADLKTEGLDEEFIQCVVDELEESHTVEVYMNKRIT